MGIAFRGPFEASECDFHLCDPQKSADQEFPGELFILFGGRVPAGRKKLQFNTLLTETLGVIQPKTLKRRTS